MKQIVAPILMIVVMFTSGCGAPKANRTSSEIREVLRSLPKDASTSQVEQALGKPQSIQDSEGQQLWTYVSPGELPVLVRFTNGHRSPE